MATLLDVGFFSHFAPIFTFLLIFAVIFAILESKKLLGEHRGLNAIVAFSVASLFVLSGFAVKIVALAAPYFVILFIFIVFVLLSVNIFGISMESIKSAVTGKYDFIMYFVVIFGIVIVMLVLGQVFGQSLLTEPIGQGDVNISYSGNITSSQNFEQNLWNTVFHPKVIGLIFLLIIASFTIRLLAQKVEK